MEKPKYKVSVIVRAYNVETTIEKCLISLITQTINPQLQVIIVDDYSIDNTSKIIGRVLNAYPDFKERTMVIHNNKNYGAGIGIIKAKEHIQGKYVAILDADDYYKYSYSLEYLYNLSEEKGSDLIKCGTYHWEFFYDSDLFIRCPHNEFRMYEDHYTWWCEKHARKLINIEPNFYFVHYNRDNPNSLVHTYKEQLSETTLRIIYEQLIFKEEKELLNRRKEQLDIMGTKNLPEYLLPTYNYLKEYVSKV